MGNAFPLPDDLELAEDGTLLFTDTPFEPADEPWRVIRVPPVVDKVPLRPRLSGELDAIDRLEFGLDIDALVTHLRASGQMQPRTSRPPPPLPPIAELDPADLELLDS